MDDATLQDGGSNRWDLERTAMPHFSRPCYNGVSRNACHHAFLLFFSASGNECLCLDDGSFWYDRTVGAVVNFSKDGDDLTCKGNGREAGIRKESTTVTRLLF